MIHKMNPSDALKILDNATQQLKLTRPEHQVLVEALTVLQALVNQQASAPQKPTS